MARASASLAVFVKPPVPGQVKTRLQPLLGPEGATRLYAAFVADTLAFATRVEGVRVVLWVAGDPNHPSVLQVPGAATLLRYAQIEGDLGARMQAALHAGLADHAQSLVIGSDAPSLPTAYLVAALRALRTSDAVLGPSVDGGYYLVGASRPVDGMFDGVRWSSRRTRRDTLRSARRLGITMARIAPWYDVDTPADLQLLRMHLRLRPNAAPATARALGLR